MAVSIVQLKNEGRRHNEDLNREPFMPCGALDSHRELLDDPPQPAYLKNAIWQAKLVLQAIDMSV